IFLLSVCFPTRMSCAALQNREAALIRTFTLVVQSSTSLHRPQRSVRARGVPSKIRHPPSSFECASPHARFGRRGANFDAGASSLAHAVMRRDGPHLAFVPADALIDAVAHVVCPFRGVAGIRPALLTK